MAGCNALTSLGVFHELLPELWKVISRSLASTVAVSKHVTSYSRRLAISGMPAGANLDILALSKRYYLLLSHSS